jgi:hypothetical protein
MDARSPTTMQPNHWCDREVLAAWRKFIELTQQRDVPTEVLVTMVMLDHELFKGRQRE